MTVWQGLGMAFYVAFVAWSLVRVLGLHRRANRIATAEHLVVSEQPHLAWWVRGGRAIGVWRTRPRPRLSGDDWNPKGGFMFVPAILGVCLIGAGLHAAIAAHQKYRLASLPLTGAGAALVALVVLFLLRPVGVPGGKFELRSAGYDPAEVDAFMATINSRARADLETVTFHLARPGYEFAAVDDKIDRLLGATPTDARHRLEGKHVYHARRP